MGVLESIRYKINKNIYFFNQYIEKKKILMHPFKEKIKVFLEKIYYNTKSYQKNLITLVILAVVVLFFLIPICDFCYNYIFFYPLDKVSQFNTTNVTEKATIENLYRTTSIQFVTIIAQILGSLALLVGLIFAWGNLNVAKEGQITERFTRAVDQLGNPAQEIRLGGVHALGRISKESKKDYSTIMTILADYVRINSNIYNHSENRYPKYGSFSMDILANETTTSDVLDGVVSTDIQATLNVIGEHKSFFNSEKDKRLGMKGAFLRGADLTGLHFEGVIFSWANLESTKIVETHLDGANLYQTNLKFATIAAAELKNARLEEADLLGAKIIYSHLEGANLKKANLKYANLEGTNFEGADLRGANLEKTSLFLAHLEKTVLDEANLKEAFLRLAHLDGAQLRGVNLEGANLDSAFLENTYIGYANLKGAKLLHANLKNAVLGSSNLENADLSNAKLEKINLYDAKLQGANLIGANLEGGGLYNADFRGANLIAANLEEAHLHGANLRGADLEVANLRGADLRGANLIAANLEGAHLDNANLERAFLDNTNNLSVDQLSKVKSLKGAKIDERLLVAFKDKYPELYQNLYI